MRRINVLEFVSLDGVTQAIANPQAAIAGSNPSQPLIGVTFK
jgi:hypothetical protein